MPLKETLVRDRVMLKVPPKFIQSERIQILAQRSRELAISGKRNLYGGDHACWIDTSPLLRLAEIPFRVNGYEATGESWGAMTP